MKNRKIIFLVILCLLLFLSLTTYLKPAKRSSKQHIEIRNVTLANKKVFEPKSVDYSKKIITTINAGNKKDEIGIDANYFTQGPSDIFLDKNENVYIADSVNKRIKKFSRNGRFLKNIPLKVKPTLSIIDDKGFIYVYSDDFIDFQNKIKILKLNQNGKILLTYSLFNEFKPDVTIQQITMDVKGSINPKIEGNRLWIELPIYYYQNPYKPNLKVNYSVRVGTTTRQFSFKTQRKSIRPSKQLFNIKENVVTINDSSRKRLTIKPPLEEGAIDTVKFSNDAIYISANQGVVEFTIFVYSKGGKLLAVVKPFEKLKNWFDWKAQNAFAVSESGNIYAYAIDINGKNNAFQIVKLTPKYDFENDLAVKIKKDNAGNSYIGSSKDKAPTNINNQTRKVRYKKAVFAVLDAGPKEGDVGIISYGGEQDAVNSGPLAITADEVGNVYLLDIVNNRIKKLSRTGEFVKNIQVPLIYGAGAKNIEIDKKQNIYVYYESSIPDLCKINQEGTVLLHYYPNEIQQKKFSPYSYLSTRDNLLSKITPFKNTNYSQLVWETGSDFFAANDQTIYLCGVTKKLPTRHDEKPLIGKDYFIILKFKPIKR